MPQPAITIAEVEIDRCETGYLITASPPSGDIASAMLGRRSRRWAFTTVEEVVTWVLANLKRDGQ